MKRPSSFLRGRSEMDSDQAMTPMIDVIFLLLVFFVCTASFQLIEKLLPTELSPETGSQATTTPLPPEQQDFEQVVIRLEWDGTTPQYRINGAPVEGLPAVQAALRSLAAVKRDAPLILHPDPAVPLGIVIEAYDEARLAGFAKVSFAVNPRASL